MKVTYDPTKYHPFNLVDNPMVSNSYENCLQNVGYYREKAKWAYFIGYLISFEHYTEQAIKWLQYAKNIKSLLKEI